MQFFPPLDVNPGQASLTNSGFGHAEPRRDQDFSGVLSNQMERHDASNPNPSEPASPAVRGSDVPPAREHGGVDEDAGRPVASGAGERGSERSEEAREEKASRGDVREERQAKAAGDEPSGAALSGDADGAEHAAEHATEVSSDPEAGAEGTADADAAVTEEELREAVATLVRRAEGLEETVPGIAAAIREVQELVRRFRESVPSERGELGKVIAARIQALREEMSSARKRDDNGTMQERSMKAAAVPAREAGEFLQGAGRFQDAPASAQKGKENGDDTATGERRHVTGPVSKAGETGSVSGSVSETAEYSAGPAADASVEATAESVRARGETGAAEARPVNMEKSTAVHVRDAAEGAGAVQRSDTGDASRAGTAAGLTPREGEADDEALLARERVDKTPHTEVRDHLAGTRKDSESDGGKTDTPAELRERTGQREPRTLHDAGGDVARGRETKVASETASAGQADRGEAVRDRGRDLAPGQVSVADAADESGRSGGRAAVADGGGGRSRGDAREGFFSPGDEGRQASDKTMARSVTTKTGKNVPEAQLHAAGTGQDSQPAVQQRLEGPVNARSAEVYRQVESGAFRNLGQGVRQLVIRLDPADLGQISVILQVRGKEVQAVLRASNQETSHALGEQMSQLRAHLESQGLRVSRLEVQTQLADSQEQSQWQGAEEHNRYQENRELALSAQRWRNMGRADSGLVQDVQSVFHREKLSQTGLDIFA